MYFISISTLSYQASKAIKNHEMSDEQMRAFANKLREDLKSKKKVLLITLICLAVLFLVLMCVMAFRAGDYGMFLNSGLIMVPTLALIALVVWLTQFGILKMRFNRLARKHYPEIANEIKI